MGRHQVACANDHGTDIRGRLIPHTVDIETGDDIDNWGGPIPDGALIAVSAGAYAECPAILTRQQATELRDLLTSIIEGN